MREMAPELMRFTLPVELNQPGVEARDSRERNFVYGSIPVMVTAQCIRKQWKDAEMSEYSSAGSQRRSARNRAACCNTIYNSSPLSLLKDKSR